MNLGDLKNVTTNLLIEELPDGLKQTIDDGLALGANREQLWLVLQVVMWEHGLKDWHVIYLAVHAYLFPDREEVPGYPQIWASLGPPRSEIARLMQS
jgi:hypothetical protein